MALQTHLRAKMALFSVLQVVLLIADEVNWAEEVEGQPAKGAEAEIDPRTRQSCSEVHEGGVVVKESGRGGAADKIVLAGSAECPEVYVSLAGVGPRQVQRRGSRKGSLGSTEDLEDRLGTRASVDKILLGVTPEDSEADKHHHSQAETSCGREDERSTAHIHQNLPEEASPLHDHTGNNPLDQQPDIPEDTPGRHAPETANTPTEINRDLELDEGVSSEERHRETEAEEEMKRALKFSYYSTGIAGAGIVGIYSGYLGDQTGHAHAIHLKFCTFFMLATFISGASILLLTLLHLSCHISIKIFRGLKVAALAFLTLAMFDISFLFLKIFAMLAFVPTLVIVMIAFFLALCDNGLPCCHHQGNSGRSFDHSS